MNRHFCISLLFTNGVLLIFGVYHANVIAHHANARPLKVPINVRSYLKALHCQ